jgi:enamine deaminase RidA (YjgF/YER057c/UK114 family)
VRVGDNLFISGTTAMTESGEVVGLGDAYEQTRYVIDFIKRILSRAGFQPSDVVRTRLFVTRLARWEDYARAHREGFGDVRPASSIIEVSRLVDPRFMVEMEVDALRGAVEVESINLHGLSAPRPER